MLNKIKALILAVVIYFSSASVINVDTEINTESGICQIVNEYQNIDNAESNYNPQYKFGFCSDSVNLMKEPSDNSEILDTLNFNMIFCYTQCYLNPDWIQIKYYDGFAYIKKEYVMDKECAFTTYEIPYYSGTKSWMPYDCFGNNTNQYKLQQLCYTDDYGIREVNNRYCVAFGTAYVGSSIGQYVDLILEDGQILPCIVGDVKAPNDTDSLNRYTVATDCYSEFIVNSDYLISRAKRTGDISDADDIFSERVVEIIVYEKNIFE